MRLAPVYRWSLLFLVTPPAAVLGLSLSSPSSEATAAAMLAELSASKLVVRKTTAPLPKPPDEVLGFGKVIADHMLKVRTWRGRCARETLPTRPQRSTFPLCAACGSCRGFAP